MHKNTCSYFTDEDNGAFNCFDFFIVIAGLVFLVIGGGGSAIGALRMLRLVRLLTFVKGVPQLRGIITGLASGLKSVTYIVLLLFLVIYLFAIMGCLLFGATDTARFGSVTGSMLTLFQVSTKASWTNIAYTSWWGCGNYEGDAYSSENSENPSTISTLVGDFQGYKCDLGSKKPLATGAFFSFYLVLTAWVVMSLFVGVISIGMFEAFEAMKREKKKRKYLRKQEKNAARRAAVKKARMAIAEHSGNLDDPEVEAYIHQARDPLNGKEDLRDLIDNVLHPSMSEHKEKTPFLIKLQEVALYCNEVQEAAWFNNIITVTIIVVGIFIGIDTDATMACERFVIHKRDGTNPNCSESIFSVVLTYTSQFIFTVEMLVKILAFGKRFWEYWYDPWNKLDSFVVAVGFIEMSPASFIFDTFPVVVLRLLRLLRVFRLAKALPRLRSIVESLISGFSAVGWICVLIIVFNYISGCMCMLLMKGNDPFHFGRVSRAMFTILRLETLDSWDQILYINVYGCAEYPGGYPFLLNGGFTQCTDSRGLGWVAFPIFFFILIIGAYILPTVLVGIVVVSFDEATKRGKAIDEMMEEMEETTAEVKKVMPEFFTARRIRAMHEVFNEIDVDEGLNLDMEELAPFYEYVFFKLFDVNLTRFEQSQVFLVMDMDGDSELGFAEFVMFIAITKQIEFLMNNNEEFVAKAFPNGTKGRDAFVTLGTKMEDVVLAARVADSAGLFEHQMALKIQRQFRRKLGFEKANALRIAKFQAENAHDARLARTSHGSFSKITVDDKRKDPLLKLVDVARKAVDLDRIVTKVSMTKGDSSAKVLDIKKVLAARLEVVLRHVLSHDAADPAGEGVSLGPVTPLGKAHARALDAADPKPKPSRCALSCFKPPAPPPPPRSTFLKAPPVAMLTPDEGEEDEGQSAPGCGGDKKSGEKSSPSRPSPEVKKPPTPFIAKAKKPPKRNPLDRQAGPAGDDMSEGGSDGSPEKDDKKNKKKKAHGKKKAHVAAHAEVDGIADSDVAKRGRVREPSQERGPSTGRRPAAKN